MRRYWNSSRPLRSAVALTMHVVFLLLANNTSAQDYTPFPADIRSVFVGTNGGSLLSVVFDSMQVAGDTTVYHNHRLPGAPSPGCPTGCLPLSRPSWLGAPIKVAANGTHVFRNLWGDAVTIPFHTVPGDTAVIYADAEQRFLLTYEGSSNSSVLGYSDVLREWRIHHRDAAGGTIPSAMDGAPIRVGDVLGAVRLLRIDSFPLLLRPVELVGRSDPDLGLRSTAQAGIYDYQPGDEVQYRRSHFSNYGTGGPNYVRYFKHIILTRQDLPDSVSYLIRQERFDEGSSMVQVDTVPFTVSRTAMEPPWMAQPGLLYPYMSPSFPHPIPYERFEGTLDYRIEALSLCGERFWAMNMYPHFIELCGTGDCGRLDATGFPVDLYYEAVVIPGLGTYFLRDALVGNMGYDDVTQLVFFRKNGNPCGIEALVGIQEPPTQAMRLEVYPNPTDGQFRVQGLSRPASVFIHDISGKVVLMRVVGVDGMLDIEDLADGTYMVRVEQQDGGLGWSRVVVMR